MAARSQANQFATAEDLDGGVTYKLYGEHVGWTPGVPTYACRTVCSIAQQEGR
jgi:hypothetical protein